MKEYKSTVKSLRNVYEAKKGSLERTVLFGNVDHSDDIEAQNERARQEKIMAKMSSTSQTLQGAHRTVLETEGVAHDITEQLNSNRETINHIHGQVRETGGLLGQASRTLRQMQRMEVKKKVMLGGVIVLLLLVFILIIYLATAAKQTKPSN